MHIGGVLFLGIYLIFSSFRIGVTQATVVEINFLFVLSRFLLLCHVGFIVNIFEGGKVLR
jgi:hypothetical protein